MFGLFKKIEKKFSISDLLSSDFAIYQKLVGHISKAESLQKLNRVEEARKVFLEAERITSNYLNQNPQDKYAHMMLLIFYDAVGVFDRAEQIIQRLLNSGEFQLTEDEKLILSAELQKLKRQRPINQREEDSPSGFTQIYCCSNCGRVHNYISMPCPNCDWFPTTIEQVARSIIISNSHFKVPTLLILAREMGSGRAASDVVPNLINDANEYLIVPEKKQVAEKVFSLLRQNQHKNQRSLKLLRECASCGGRILLSDEKECNTCNEPVNWPDALRTLACMDNLLWLFEQRVEGSHTDVFSDFVCVLVAMTNNLLRKQEVPSLQDRQYCLQLLMGMGTVSDLEKGAIINTENPKELKMYLVRDSMREDTETFGLFLFTEMKFFAEKMLQGVRI